MWMCLLLKVREQFVLRRRGGSFGGIARSLGVGGFTDPEIDSIDAGKKFEQRQTLVTVLVFTVKTR